MSILKIKNLFKSYGKIEVLKNFSLDIDSTEFVSLLGPSGCGKTTVLKIISGFISPDKGTVFIEDIDVSNTPPEKRNTAMCFQSYALFPHLTVEDNIKFGLYEKKISKNKSKDLFEEAIEHLSLSQELGKYPNELSGGQQQRVALGRALVTRPKIILFDEPLSNLDAILRGTVRNEIKRIQSEFKLTAIYVTHDQSEALSISVRVVLMKEGEINQIDTPEKIYDNPISYFSASFVGISNIHHFKNSKVAEAFARIESHYFINNGFFDSDNWILENVNKIVAVEPNPLSLSIAAENLILNDLVSNVVFIPKAAYGKSGDKIQLWTMPGPFAAASTNIDFAESGSMANSYIDVETITLDDIAETYNLWPDLVKIDVEGVEHSVLEGSLKIAKRIGTKFIVEVHSCDSLSIVENTEKILDWCKVNNFIEIGKKITI